MIRRFIEIPKDWDIIKLEDYAIIKARIGWRGLKASEYTEEGPYLIANKHIINDKVIWEECDHLSEYRYQESPEIQLQQNDIIMSKDGTLGRVAHLDVLPGSATINSTMMMIRVINDNLFSKFLYYFFQSRYFKSFIYERVSGSTVPHIFQRDMRMLKVILPPIQEQQKIASKLTNVDNIIQLTKQIIDQLQLLRKGLLQQLFTKGIGHTEFKETKIGKIPKEWKLAKYSDVAEYINGYAFKPSDWQKRGLPIIRIQNLTNSNNDFNYFQGEIDEKYIVQEGDILFAWSATIDIFKWKGTKAVLNQHIFKVIPKERIEKYFLYYAIKRFLNRIRKKVHGSTMKHFRRGELENNYLPLPSLPEQRRITSILLNIDEKIEMNYEYKRLMEKTKNGLMQDLLTGRKRVKINN